MHISTNETFLRVFLVRASKGQAFCFLFFFFFDSILNQVVAVLYSRIQENVLYKICIEAQQWGSLKFWPTKIHARLYKEERNETG